MWSATVPAWAHAVMTVVWAVLAVVLLVAGEGSAAALVLVLFALQGTYAVILRRANGWSGPRR